jgi:hypothetical protein
VSYRYADRFVVARAQRIEIAAGDRLHLKANGRSIEGTQLHNGELVTVERVEPSGALVVTNERGKTKTLAASQRLFVRGYAVTSYASQGKTADAVIFADAGNPAATNAQQWYVTISRGRKRVMVFTPDKDQLRASIEQPRERELAIDDGRFALGVAQRQELRRRQRERESIPQQRVAQINARRGMGIHL